MESLGHKRWGLVVSFEMRKQKQPCQNLNTLINTQIGIRNLQMDFTRRSNSSESKERVQRKTMSGKSVQNIHRAKSVPSASVKFLWNTKGQRLLYLSSDVSSRSPHFWRSFEKDWKEHVRAERERKGAVGGKKTYLD